MVAIKQKAMTNLFKLECGCVLKYLFRDVLYDIMLPFDFFILETKAFEPATSSFGALNT